MENAVQSCLVTFVSGHKEIVVAIIAILGVFATAYVALRNNSKNLLVKTVTDERARWRVDLRNSSAEFSKLVYEQISNTTSTNKARIVELKAHIKLRTNPSGEPKHYLDQEIVKESQEIVDLLDEDTKENVILGKLLSLEKNIQKLLKQEWDKSKDEAKSGKLAN